MSNPLDGIVLAPPDATAWPLKTGSVAGAGVARRHRPTARTRSASAYWTQDLDQSDTNSIIEGLRDQTYPDDENFSSAQFKTAKAELIQELRWVGNTRSYLTKLSEPFASNALDGWAGAQTIADQVYNDSTASPNPVAMEWLQFTQLLLGFGGAPGQLVSRALQLGMWAYGAASDGGPGFAEVKTTADKVGTAFVTQAKTAQATLDNMGDVVVSDYAKLKEVGTWGGCNTSVTGCPASLAYSAADRKQASADVYRAIEQQAWLNLLPIGYPVFDLVPPYQSGGAPRNPPTTRATATSPSRSRGIRLPPTRPSSRYGTRRPRTRAASRCTPCRSTPDPAARRRSPRSSRGSSPRCHPPVIPGWAVSA